MAKSLAVQAYQQQNLNEDKPENTRFPGHDTWQNGVIENGQPTTLYTAASDKDIENIKNENSNMSGFMTDETTINSCKNETGVLDANELADKTQTQPWRPDNAPEGTDYTYRNSVAAFDVNWDKLNEPENADLRERLCDSDGNLKCAFGKAEENTHWGEGGGNQYYFNKEDFNEGVNRGVFRYNEDKTLKENDGAVIRKGISEDEYDIMNAERDKNIDKQLSSCQEKSASTNSEKAKSLNEMTPEKASQINSMQASKGDYLAKPDLTYNYQSKRVGDEDSIKCGTTSENNYNHLESLNSSDSGVGKSGTAKEKSLETPDMGIEM